MRILQVHNYYKQPGGEDVVLKNEFDLLISHGHEVIQFTKSNKEMNDYSFSERAKLFFNTAYSKKTYREIYELVKKSKPNICHVHNTMPLISPSVYYACSEYNIPVIQTLHNYRLLCSNAYLFREGKVCEECIGKSLYNSVKYGCYRDSKIQTFSLARVIEKNKKWGTWNKGVNLYIALTEFAQRKFIEGGLPAEKIVVKPNFIVDPLNGQEIPNNSREGALFVGRLSEEKGMRALLKAFRELPEVRLTIVGDGPLKELVVQDVRKYDNINYAGRLSKAIVFKHMLEASFLIFPSQWYEGFPMTIVEAFACGLPVIASRLGAMEEIIEDGKTGLLFTPGNVNELKDKIRWANEHPEEITQMGRNARKEYLQKFTPEQNYHMLMDIYQKALEFHKDKHMEGK